MPAHVWDSKIDFEYCTLNKCKIINNSVVLNNSLTGSIISEVKDSTDRIFDYNEVLPKVDVPDGTSATLYMRSGWYEEYYDDCWTDWVQVNEPTTRMEYMYSLTSKKIVADYDIGRLRNIYYISDRRFLSLASSLKTMFLNGIDPNIPYADELYAILWSGEVGEAIVNFAKVGHDSTAQTIYATDASTVDNIVILKNELPTNSAGLILEYVPRYSTYSDNKNRYLQWKYEFVSDSLNTSPTLRSLQVNYRLDFHDQMKEAVPGLYKRL